MRQDHCARQRFCTPVQQCPQPLSLTTCHSQTRHRSRGHRNEGSFGREQDHVGKCVFTHFWVHCNAQYTISGVCVFTRLRDHCNWGFHGCQWQHFGVHVCVCVICLRFPASDENDEHQLIECAVFAIHE